MSRNVIINLAARKLDQSDPATRVFFQQLATSELRNGVQWRRILGADGSADWKPKAVNCVLAQMYRRGSDSAPPPIDDIARRMLAKERAAREIATDNAWWTYFLRGFHQAQRSYLSAELGTEGKEVFRKKLRKSLAEMPEVTGHHYSFQRKSFQYFGLPDADDFFIDADTICAQLEARAPLGGSKSHAGNLPTPAQVKALIAEVLDRHPRIAPSFSVWYEIVRRVFRLDFGGHQPPKTDKNGKSVDQEPETESDSAGRVGDWASGMKDSSAAKKRIEEAITSLDHGTALPEGDHARLFLEYWIFQASRGPLRITLLAYSDRKGIPYNTLDSRRKKLEDALAKACRGEIDPEDFVAAIDDFRDEFLDLHREVFPN